MHLLALFGLLPGHNSFTNCLTDRLTDWVGEQGEETTRLILVTIHDHVFLDMSGKLPIST